MSYNNLPYLRQEDFPTVEYGKAGALRVPLRDAINTARSMPDDRMDQVIEILETALAHINRGEQNEVPANTSDDPLDELLGTA